MLSIDTLTMDELKPSQILNTSNDVSDTILDAIKVESDVGRVELFD